ncbi:MAG: triose-phosphate isomerase [Phycisphaerae bacterium]|nr:triose-phosphate isomerase [Phycisphaerae bacterium]
MHPARRPFVGGNWKMNTSRQGAIDLARAVATGIESSRCEVVIFPPFPWLLPVADAVNRSRAAFGAQDLSVEAQGAFTGQVSAEMIVDCGATWAIIGHSERRHGLAESPELCGAKLRRALDAKLSAVLCVGETWEERSAGRTDEINRMQLDAALAGVPAEALARIVVAYEPVWAIGTGRTATVDDADAAHRAIRRFLGNRYAPAAVEGVRIIYGGSVNAGNARSLFSAPEIDGGLIGGASLKAAEFLSIVAATELATASTRS